MTTATKRKKASGWSRKSRFYPGITRHAKALGVTHTHLYLVLAGQRTSQRLLANYKALVGMERDSKEM